MQKSAILINSLRCGGAECIVSFLLNHLKNSNSQLEIILLEKPLFYNIPPNIKITYLSGYSGNETGIKKFIYLLYFAVKLKKYCRAGSISVVQSHLFRANYVNILSKLIGSKHTVHIVNHENISSYYIKGLSAKANLFLIKILYPAADLIIAISKAMKLDMENQFGIKNKIKVIPNFYDINYIIQKSKEKLNHNEFNFKKNVEYIISIGRLHWKKQYDILIKSFKIINKKRKNSELIIIGDGEEKKNLILLAMSINIINKIHFPGEIPNPYKYLKKSSVFILTSVSEGFPNVLIEAMICRCPVVSTDCSSGPREILAPDTKADYKLKNNIEYSKYGILTPVSSEHKIAEAVLSLLENKNLRNKYSNSAYERAKKFSINNIISEYEKIFPNR